MYSVIFFYQCKYFNSSIFKFTAYNFKITLSFVKTCSKLCIVILAYLISNNFPQFNQKKAQIRKEKKVTKRQKKIRKIEKKIKNVQGELKMQGAWWIRDGYGFRTPRGV